MEIKNIDVSTHTSDLLRCFFFPNVWKNQTSILFVVKSIQFIVVIFRTAINRNSSTVQIVLECCIIICLLTEIVGDRNSMIFPQSSFWGHSKVYVYSIEYTFDRWINLALLKLRFVVFKIIQIPYWISLSKRDTVPNCLRKNKSVRFIEMNDNTHIFQKKNQSNIGSNTNIIP